MIAPKTLLPIALAASAIVLHPVAGQDVATVCQDALGAQYYQRLVYAVQDCLSAQNVLPVKTACKQQMKDMLASNAALQNNPAEQEIVATQCLLSGFARCVASTDEDHEVCRSIADSACCDSYAAELADSSLTGDARLEALLFGSTCTQCKATINSPATHSHTAPLAATAVAIAACLAM